MEGLLLVAVLVVLAIRWWVIKERLDRLTRDRIDPSEITRLIRRIAQLENQVAELRRAGAPVKAEPAPVAAPKPEPAMPPIPAVVAPPVPATLRLRRPQPRPRRRPLVPRAPAPNGKRWWAGTGSINSASWCW